MPADRSPQTSGEENTIRNIVTRLHKPSLLKSMCFNLELVRKNGKCIRDGVKLKQAMILVLNLVVQTFKPQAFL